MIKNMALFSTAAMGALLLSVAMLAERQQPGAMIAAPFLVVGSLVIVAACFGKRWAMRICLFLVVLVVDMSFRSRDLSDMSVDGAVMFRLVLWSAALAVGLANLPESWRYFRNASCIGLLAYLVVAAFSALYSLVPRYTLGCLYGYVCMFPFMAAAVARLGVRDTIRILLLAIGAHVAIAVALWPVAPDIVMWRGGSGSEMRLRGLVGHPFRMAEVAAIFLLSGWIMWQRGWMSTLALAAVGALGGLALALTQTRSSMLAVAVALASVGRFRSLGIAAFAATAIAALIAVNVSPQALGAIALQFSRGDEVQSTLTLTGRTHIWSESLRLFSERPLLGYGFAATRALFPQEFLPAKEGGEAPSHAHNILVQSLVATGIIGTLLLLVPLGLPILHSLRHRDGLTNPITWYVVVVGVAGLGPIGTAPRSLTIVWILSLLMIHWREGATVVIPRIDAGITSGVPGPAIGRSPPPDLSGARKALGDHELA